VIKSKVAIQECRLPGLATSKCITKEETRTILDCEEDWCFRGRCYPQNCTDGVLEYNEVDIDCGGKCPLCESLTNRTCSQSGDCGTDHIKPGFMCNGDNITQWRVTYSCVDRKCTSKTELATYRECTGEYKCFLGEKSCRTHKGTCGDCKKDGDEENINCGGSCWPCAIMPENDTTDDTHMVLYFPDTDNVFTYKGYDIRFMQPLFNDESGNNCTYGVIVRVRRPDLTTVDLEVTRYKNDGVDNIVLGFYWADKRSAKIWVTG
jgi:hypothetical protein